MSRKDTSSCFQIVLETYTSLLMATFPSTESQAPPISVVLPVWNGEAYIADAIKSILNQSFCDFELTVVDDGSTDRTREIVDSFKDSRIHLHTLEHAGIVNALNYGVSQTHAEWIARQDADDLSMPTRLEEQWAAVRGKADAVLSYTDVEVIGEGSEFVGRAHFPRTKAFLALRLCFQCPIAHSTVLFRK